MLVDPLLAWFASAAPIAGGVAIAAIPGVAVAIINEVLARRRERRVVLRDEMHQFSIALQGVVTALADLSEVRSNPSRNAGRNGEVSARFRVALATADLFRDEEREPVLKWLRAVAERINVSNVDWIDLERFDENVVEPIAKWQEGELQATWFDNQLLNSPVRPAKASVE